MLDHKTITAVQQGTLKTLMNKHNGLKMKLLGMQSSSP